MKKNKLIKKIALGMTLAMCATSLFGCGQTGSNKPTDNSQIENKIISIKTKLTNAKIDGEKLDGTGKTLTTMVSFTPPPATHGNPAVNGGPDWSMVPLIYDYLCDYSAQPEKTFKPSLLDSYKFENKVLTLNLKKDLKWSDGSPLNADDIMNDIFVNMTVNKVAYYAESITKKDDTTIEIKYAKDSTLMLDYLLKFEVKYSKKEYGKWGSQFQKVFETMREKDDKGGYKFTKDGDKKQSEINNDMYKYLPDLTKILCSGPFVPEKVTSSEIIFKKNPYYRINVPIEKVRGIRPTSTESTAVAIMNKDYTIENMGLSPDLAQKVVEKNSDTIRQVEAPEYSELGFAFNVNKAPTNNLAVRKAIAYIIDKKQIAPVSEPGMRLGDEYAVGLPPTVRDKYLDKTYLNTLENYTMDKDKAKKLLESAGWKKQGNKWVDANGQSPEIKIAGVGEYPAYVIMGEAAANMLKDFGLNATFTPKEAAAYNDYSMSGDAQMVISGFGSPSSTQHPFEAYDGIWWYGKMNNIKFPTSGGLVFKDEKTNEDFKYSEKETELFDAATAAEITEKTKAFAKFFNDNMWYIPVTEKFVITRIYDPKLSLAEAQTGKEIKDFYWGAMLNVSIGKMIRGEKIYFVK
ncbi:ABC transporter substrate-binding protein [Inconstantimicrobium mannanitabidum]|uniref:Peptide ABC transporter substrate-binding protein n=1 Tax=Inconstantimicrobium mannanitabidum TaxID=1604901 RepID=A0ACB5RCJ9_9CLOT|nr:ABC transporter substrate-binding protein [Clostridium sp. TW13]GKX66816.1 peptide ABC transporter substrate-binding protein [Clostridium sp. TW13]